MPDSSRKFLADFAIERTSFLDLNTSLRSGWALDEPYSLGESDADRNLPTHKTRVLDNLASKLEMM